MFSTQFIRANTEFSGKEKLVNAPYLRREFRADLFGSASISICGLGFYRLFINGHEITRGLLSPYISNPDDLVYFDTYDVSELLCAGDNCIGLILGNGMQNAYGGENWNLNVGPFVGAPRVALSLELDGKTVLEADDAFRWAPSPILFDDMRYGEHYDARLEQDGWNLVGFDDSGWANCTPAPTPNGKFRPNLVPPIAVREERRPVKIWKSKTGYIYDFGYNSAGLCALKIKGEPGQKLVLSYVEVVIDGEIYTGNLFNRHDDRTLGHKDIYICRGEGVEEYQPSFTYHGFRYVCVDGITEEQATEDLLTYRIYNSKFERLTEFSCANETVNRLQAMCDNSSRSNFYHIPTDCPQREKNGWTGDAAISAEQMLLNYDCETNFSQWMQNVCAAQREDGAFPGIVPTTGWGFTWGNGPAWDHVIGVVPAAVYKYTGDLGILRENAPTLYRYLRYMRTKKEGRTLAYGLGDWCEIMADKPNTPLEITDSLICYNLCRTSSFIFSQLDMTQERRFADELADEIYRDFRAEYITETGLCRVETQTAYAMLIAYGMLTADECAVAIERLVALIHENGDKMRVGILGARVIFHVLSAYGYGDLALHMIIDDKYPSYGEWVKKGQTSLWERFHRTEEGESLVVTDGKYLTSLNHHMFSDISQWFIQNILGIRVNPDMTDCRRIVISPCTLSAIDHASGAYRRAGSAVTVEWHKDDRYIYLTVKQEGSFTVEFDLGATEVIERTDAENTTAFKLARN